MLWPLRGFAACNEHSYTYIDRLVHVLPSYTTEILSLYLVITL